VVGVVRQRAGELLARADVELRKHLVQVVLDRPRADEQLSADLRVRAPGACKAGDLNFLRGKRFARLVDPPACGFPGGEELAAGSEMETELRACAVHACELLAARWGVAPRVLDNWLWNRGQGLPGRPHITRTVFY